MRSLHQGVALLLLGGLLVGCAGSRGQLRARGMEDANSTAAALHTATTPKRVALLVGIDGYRDPVFGELLHASADATSLYEALGAKGVGGFDRLELLATDATTGREQVLAAMARLGRDLRAEDVFVLYFSGHGTVAPGRSGQGRPYLLAADSSAGDLPGTAIDLATIVAWMGSLPSQRKALIVDACFNGRGKSTLNPELAAGLGELLEGVRLSDSAGLGTGEAHLFATSVGRPAFEDDELGHGLYTHYLLQAMSWARGDADLDGDGVLTAWEAHDYARGRVMERTGGEQVPEGLIRVVGDNDLVLAGDPATRAARDQALVFDFSGSRSVFAGATVRIDGRARGVLPGAILVEPGRHHVEIVDEDGTIRMDGYARLRAGETLALSNLRVALREDRVLQYARVGFAPQTGPLAEVWGAGFASVEAGGLWRRARPPLPGFVVGGFVGLGLAPTREGATGLVQHGRGIFWFGGEAGWGGGIRRFRPRLTWQVRSTVLPRSVSVGAGTDGAGWFILSTGPSVALGLAVSRRFSLQLAGTLQATFIELSGDDSAQPRLFGNLAIGVEIAL